MDQEMGLMIIAPPSQSLTKPTLNPAFLRPVEAPILRNWDVKLCDRDGREGRREGGRRVMLAIKSTCLPDHTATTTLLQCATNLPPDLRIFAAFSDQGTCAAPGHLLKRWCGPCGANPFHLYYCMTLRCWTQFNALMVCCTI